MVHVSRDSPIKRTSERAARDVLHCHVLNCHWVGLCGGFSSRQLCSAAADFSYLFLTAVRNERKTVARSAAAVSEREPVQEHATGSDRRKQKEEGDDRFACVNKMRTSVAIVRELLLLLAAVGDIILTLRRSGCQGDQGGMICQ